MAKGKATKTVKTTRAPKRSYIAPRAVGALAGAARRQERAIAAAQTSAQRKANAIATKAARDIQREQRRSERALIALTKANEKNKALRKMASAGGMAVPIVARDQFGFRRSEMFPKRARIGKATKAGIVTVTTTTKARRKFATKEGASKYVNKLGGVMLVSGGVGLVAYGAMDYAGISDALPTQKYLGISLAGWLGITSLIFARWVFSAPMVKDGAYGVGISLIAYEAARQVGTRFADWSALGDNWSGAFNELESDSQGVVRWGRRAVRAGNEIAELRREQREAMAQMNQANNERQELLLKAMLQSGMQRQQAAA